MTAPTCVCCGQQTPDGYACVRCAVERPRAQLAEIAQLAGPARDVAHRQAVRGTGGAASGKPGSQIPIDLGAQARIDAVENALTTWVRHVAEIRGAPAQINGGGRTGVPGGTGTSEGGRDALRASAAWLADHCEWLRHRAEVDEFLTDVAASARVLRGIVNGPGERCYLGPCGADLTTFTAETGIGNGGTCDGDVYGPARAAKGSCRTCGAVVDQDERRAWLDDEVRRYAYTVPEIAGAYPIKRNTINQWVSRGRLTAHDHDENGRARYNLGEVLDLAAGDAARREEQRAKRDQQRHGSMMLPSG